MPNANKAIALTPNIKFSTLMMKNNVGLPAFNLSAIYDFLVYNILSITVVNGSMLYN